MALEGPRLHYARFDDTSEDTLARALRLAREIEELLEEAPSSPGVDLTTASLDAHGVPCARGAHSTRMACAMAAGLVDELQVLVRIAKKKTGVA